MTLNFFRLWLSGWGEIAKAKPLMVIHDSAGAPVSRFP